MKIKFRPDSFDGFDAFAGAKRLSCTAFKRKGKGKKLVLRCKPVRVKRASSSKKRRKRAR